MGFPPPYPALFVAAYQNCCSCRQTSFMLSVRGTVTRDCRVGIKKPTQKTPKKPPKKPTKNVFFLIFNFL